MSNRNESRTDQALELVRQGVTAYRAAKQCGIALSTIYRAIKRERERNERKAEKQGN